MRQLLVVSMITFLGMQVAAAAVNLGVQKTIIESEKVKISKALRDVAEPIPALTKQRKIKLQQSGEAVPGVDKVRIIPNRFPEQSTGKQGEVKDGAAQKSLLKARSLRNEPATGVSFDGVGNVFGSVPPDTNGDVGPEHYVQTVNVAMGVFDKEGNVLVNPTPINALWNGFGGICETNNNGDPIVLYDSAADRWMISQFALASGDNHQCIAISRTGDPTGEYYLYDFPYGELMNDYPKFGVWTDGYYMGVNQFGAGFANGGVVAYERDKMLVGAEARQIKIGFENSQESVYTPMPLDIDGFLPPPQGAKQYFLTLGNAEINVWQFAVDWNNPDASDFTKVVDIPVASYGQPPMVTQPNGAGLSTIDDRIMFRAAYRNLDGQGKIVFTHNVASPVVGGEAALRWYELDVDQIAGTASLVNQGTFAPDTTSRWMGSAAMDVNGNIAVGYSIASPDLHPSINAATRLATDPANTLTSEIRLHTGSGSQAPVNRGRWGDYSSMSVDPVDECTFWFTTEYYKAENTDTTSWSTRVSSFKIPTCSMGPTGEVTGVVVTADEAATPIANITVNVGMFATKTNAEGEFRLVLPVGDYDVIASGYGWIEGEATAVTIEEEETTDVKLTLEAADAVTVTGKVFDSALNAGLYARIDVQVPESVITTFTNPTTGEYSIDLFAGTTVAVRVEELAAGGYLPLETELLPAVGMENVDYDLVVNANCTAPGYKYELNTFTENFDVFPPAGWTILDNNGEGLKWSSLAAANRPDIEFDLDAAISDSDRAGQGVTGDTSLVTPVIGIDEISSPLLTFDSFFRTLTGADVVAVDIAVDGGEWARVGTIPATRRIENNSFDLSAFLEGASSFQLRWRHYNTTWEWYAAIDNIQIGEGTCDPVAGQVINGMVTDANTGDAVVGAAVVVDGVVVANSTLTEDDSALADGYFRAFVPAGAEAVTVAKEGYVSKSVAVEAVSVASPIALDAGLLSLEKADLEISVTAGRQDSLVLGVANLGKADVSISELIVNNNADLVINGPFHPSARHFGPKNLNDHSAKMTRYFPEINVPELRAGDLVGAFRTNYAWSIARDRKSGEFFIGDLRLLKEEDEDAEDTDEVLWRHAANGERTEDKLVNTFAEAFMADTAFNQRTGMLWQVEVGDENCIHEIDTASMTYTGEKLCPEIGVSQRGLAYDPITNTFYSGSWNDSVIHQFDTKGNVLRSVNVGLPVAGLAFNPSTQHLFVSVNTAKGGNNYDIVVLDARSETFTKVGAYNLRFDIDRDGVKEELVTANGQGGLDIDCNGNLWMVEFNIQLVVGFQSGETGVCDWNNVPWLSIANSADKVNAESGLALEFAVDTTGLAVGEYEALVILNNDTPYGAAQVPVKLTVTEPQYGNVRFGELNQEITLGDYANVVVERVDGADFAISVDYIMLSGSAKAGESFVPLEGTLTWEDGDTEPKMISAATMKTGEEGNFIVKLIDPKGGAKIDGENTTVIDLVKPPKNDSGALGYSIFALLLLSVFGRRRSQQR